MTAQDPHRRPAPPTSAVTTSAPSAAPSPPPPSAHYPPLIPYYPHPHHHHPPYLPPHPPLPPNQLPHHGMPLIRPVNVIHVPRPPPAVPLPVSLPNLPRPLKAGAASMAPNSFNCNGGARDFRGKDDTPAVIRERKVMASNKDSLYSLCRSWLRSGYIQELQPQYGDGVKSLPKPLPLSAVESSAVPKEEGQGDASGDDKQEEENVEDLSASDLLKRHVKHAKRVRTRLREERLQRIAGYKTRLALLLPPQVEQFKNDTVA
ncbi:hypothetical protein MLD38_022957 [Melastoma candidum]|uniref:Uncharacterized protein n=1 Tax=Melastoma candidum TaxID=119954 RepID=A0ACB9QM67_9MYRT|nr:hypothetical protein MLD38_022957 [Melastoma candidum]